MLLMTIGIVTESFEGVHLNFILFASVPNFVEFQGLQRNSDKAEELIKL